MSRSPSRRLPPEVQLIGSKRTTQRQIASMLHMTRDAADVLSVQLISFKCCVRYALAASYKPETFVILGTTVQALQVSRCKLACHFVTSRGQDGQSATYTGRTRPQCCRTNRENKQIGTKRELHKKTRGKTYHSQHPYFRFPNHRKQYGKKNRLTVPQGLFPSKVLSNREVAHRLLKGWTNPK